MRNFHFRLAIILVLAGLPLMLSRAYPIDGWPETHIDRLLYQLALATDSTRNSPLDPGALWPMERIQLRMNYGDRQNDSFPETDDTLQREISQFFRHLEPQYSASVLIYTEGKPLRYAERKSNVGYQPGSVGKLAVVVGFFAELHKIYGDDWASKRKLMMEKVVKAGSWGVPNHHTIPFYDVETGKYWKRKVVQSDTFTLYQWLDHMVSISSNAAASICWREAILMRAFGEEYHCTSQWDADKYFEYTPRSELAEIARQVVNDPLREMGIGEDEWRLGTFFTRGASNIIPPKGGSIGTTQGLMKFIIALERGQVIDNRTSLEIKRLMYLTDRRIRYAASPALNDYAVFFKSGSYYSCKSEAGFTCRKYAGNRFNYMNSVALIEKPDCTLYAVVLMSNVLRKNSAWEHYNLASQIDRLIEDGGY